MERLCHEQQIPYERLFTDLKRPLTYEFNLSRLKELDQLRERYLIIGNRSILDFITTNDQAEVERVLINACLTSNDDLITCQFIHAPIGAITMVLEIHPVMNTKRPDTSFLELRFTNVNDFIQNSPDVADLSVLSNDLTLFK